MGSLNLDYLSQELTHLALKQISKNLFRSLEFSARHLKHVLYSHYIVQDF